MRSSLTLSACTLALVVAVPFIAAADTLSELRITPDGAFTATGITVYQKAGRNFFTRATWGQAFIRVTVLTNASTTVVKNHGEAGAVEDINEQDTLDVVGTLSLSGDSVNIIAKNIRDYQLLSAPKTLSGSVKSVDAGATSFVLSNSTFATTTVQLAGGAQITKGARTIFLPDLAVGDKILSAAGTYDYTTNTLSASSVSVYQEKSVFTPKNFQGTLKSLTATQLPTTAVVAVGTTDYTVYLPAGATILKNNKSAATLSRFVVGDTVRFYGAIRQTNLTEVDADIFRDLNF